MRVWGLGLRVWGLEFRGGRERERDIEEIGERDEIEERV